MKLAVRFYVLVIGAAIIFCTGLGLLESNAAFFAAQMTTMDTATKNSADMISSLTLYMTKVRQAAIPREIIEVVSGAQAL